MKQWMLVVFLSLVMFLSFTALAQDSASAPAGASSSIVAEATPLPPVVPPDEISDTVIKWLKFLYQVPVIGEYIATAVQVIALLSTFLTGLFFSLLAFLKSLVRVLKWAKFIEAAEKLEAFQYSKFFYWLKWASNFTKPEVKPQPTLVDKV